MLNENNIHFDWEGKTTDTPVPTPEQPSGGGFTYQSFDTEREQPADAGSWRSALTTYPPSQFSDPPPAFQTAPEMSAEPVKEKRRPKNHGVGLIAALVAVAIISGMAGGGAVAWWFTVQQPKQSAVAADANPTIPMDASAGGVSLVSPTGDMTAIVDKAAASVVEISLATRVRTFFGEQDVPSAGSGVIVSENGYIVTNNHVVEGAEMIQVRTSDGTEYEAVLIGTDSQTDLAVIKIEATGLTPATFADSDSVLVGQIAVAIGNPLGTLGGTVTNGIISASGREITIDDQTMNLIQTSAAVNPGNSGGGLFDAYGKLIGVVNAKSSGLGVEGLGFAIPSNIVRAVAQDLMDKGYVTGRPEVGIKIIQVDDPRAAAYYGVDGTGVFIMESTRPNNGLRAGDRIIDVDGKAVESADDVIQIIGAAQVGDVLRITLERGGERIIVDVPVTEQIPDAIRETLSGPTGKI